MHGPERRSHRACALRAAAGPAGPAASAPEGIGEERRCKQGGGSREPNGVQRECLDNGSAPCSAGFGLLDEEKSTGSWKRDKSSQLKSRLFEMQREALRLPW